MSENDDCPVAVPSEVRAEDAGTDWLHPPCAKCGKVLSLFAKSYFVGSGAEICEECYADKCHVCGGDRYVMFEGKSLPCGECNFQVHKERDFELPQEPDYHVIEGGVCYLNREHPDFGCRGVMTPADDYMRAAREQAGAGLEAERHYYAVNQRYKGALH